MRQTVAVFRERAARLPYFRPRGLRKGSRGDAGGAMQRRIAPRVGSVVDGIQASGNCGKLVEVFYVDFRIAVCDRNLNSVIKE